MEEKNINNEVSKILKNSNIDIRDNKQKEAIEKQIKKVLEPKREQVININWIEENLEEVMKHFVKGYKLKNDFKLYEYDFWIDEARNRVLFKLVMKK